MKCFVYRDDEVLGPFDESELEGFVSVDDKIWALGSKTDEWLSKEEWLQSKDKIVKGLSAASQSVDWYLVITDKRMGPMKKAEIASALADVEELKEVYLWNKNLTTWTSIYKFKDILNNIGKEKRKNLRVEVNESVAVTKVNDPEGQSFICKANNLSAEGIGIVDAPKGIHSGDEINISLSFIDPNLSVRSMVLFRNQNDSLNVKFGTIQGEAKSMVVDYINYQLNLIQSGKAA